MPVTFYPNEDDLKSSNIQEKIEVLMEAAERYRGIILDAQKAAAVAPTPAPTPTPAPASASASGDTNSTGRKRISPRDIINSFNWEELAKLLREIRELPESNPSSKVLKANHLVKLAEIYEVLRAAKMPKLEAVRLALMNEANQLRGS